MTSGASTPAAHSASDSASGTLAMEHVLDSLSTAVMLCDRRTFKITYANSKSVDIIRALLPHLPKGIDPENMVGQSIDQFHAKPEHQRKLLADNSRLPHSTIFRIGKEFIELTVEKVKGSDHLLSVCWAIVTQREMLNQMVQTMPLNAMLADPDSLELTFVNDTSLKTLKRVEHLLPVKVSEMQGQCIDIFHKFPERARRVLSDERNLPHHAVIQLGDEYLDLNVAAIRDRRGDYIAPMLNWSIVTDNVHLARDVKDVTELVRSSSQTLLAVAETMVAQTGKGTNRTINISEDTQATKDNFNSVAAAAEELSASVGELQAAIERSDQMAGNAVSEAETLNSRVARLEEAAREIGGIVKLIDDIASKTNMLALNATIEAARAGEAGRGFAVVANEVKALAKQTSDSTARIAKSINDIRTEVGHSTQDIGRIVDVIHQLSDTTQETRNSVEQQSEATREIARIVQDGSRAMDNVATNVSGLLSQNVDTVKGAILVYWKTQDMVEPTKALGGKVADFLKNTGM